MKKPIYLDYAATTPVDPEVLKVILNCLEEDFGNPSSIYGLGQRALALVDGKLPDLVALSKRGIGGISEELRRSKLL